MAANGPAETNQKISEHCMAFLGVSRLSNDALAFVLEIHIPIILQQPFPYRRYLI